MERSRGPLRVRTSQFATKSSARSPIASWRFPLPAGFGLPSTASTALARRRWLIGWLRRLNSAAVPSSALQSMASSGHGAIGAEGATCPLRATTRTASTTPPCEQVFSNHSALAAVDSTVAVFDYGRDKQVEAPIQQGPARSILLVDGVFLLRDDLVDCWEFRVFVRVTFEEALRRGVKRDAALFGSPEIARDRYQRRYLPAQRIYLEACRPEDRADLILDNEEPTAPRLVDHTP